MNHYQEIYTGVEYNDLEKDVEVNTTDDAEIF